MNSNTVVERSRESDWPAELALRVAELRELGIKVWSGQRSDYANAECPACGPVVGGGLMIKATTLKCFTCADPNAAGAAIAARKAAKAECEKLAAEERERQEAERQARWAAERAERERQAADERREQVRHRNALPERLRELYWRLDGPSIGADGQVTARCPVCGSLGALLVECYDDGSIILTECRRDCNEDDVHRALDLPTSADEDATLAWDDEPTELEWLVAGALPRGRFVSVVGKREAGKSLVMLDWAIQMAGPGERVLYLDAENPRDEIRDRLRLMGLDGVPAGLAYRFIQRIALDTEAGAAELARLARTSRATVVVLDTWSKFVAGPESAPETHTRAFVGAIRPLALDGLTIVAGDHLGKDKSAGPRGGSSKSDNVDVEWTLTADRRGAPARVTLANAKDRTGRCPQVIQLQRLASLRHVDLADQEALPADVAEALHVLELSEVPRTAGRPTAQRLLAERGHRIRTVTLAAALRVWKADQT